MYCSNCGRAVNASEFCANCVKKASDASVAAASPPPTRSSRSVFGPGPVIAGMVGLVVLIIAFGVISRDRQSHAQDSTTASGWYGWQGVGNLDRERELRGLVGNYHRILSDAMTFNQLCSQVGRVCTRVIDWEGRSKDCASGRDGSRLGFCS